MRRYWTTVAFYVGYRFNLREGRTSFQYILAFGSMYLTSLVNV